ncbi:hypothetical protein CF336_g8887, partial [Tilletia laevis]
MNSSPAVSTGVRPFDLVFVSHPSIVHAVFDYAEHFGVASFPERLTAATERLEDARAAIVAARREQKRRYDARRALLPSIHVGDRVFVHLGDRPIPGTVGSKLDARKSGPFVVEEVLSPHRVRLSLPAGVAVDPVMNIEQLDLVPTDPDPFALDRAGTPPPDPVPGSPSVCASPPFGPAVHPDLTDAPDFAPLSSARARRPPLGLRDFDLGTLAATDPELEAALRGPLARPRSMVVDGRSVRLTERPVAYISRLTTPGEQKFVASELELSCLAWAYSKLAHLLEGASVTVITDHSPMEKMLQSQNAVHYGPTISRCRALLLPHLTKLRLVYRPGPRHNNVDALSRLVPDPGRSASGGG